MIKYNSPDKLIYSDEFVKQPVNELSELLTNSTANKIILFGKRGSGKSTVLYNHQCKNIGTKSPTIFTRFDSIGMCNRKDFDNEFMTHYYELIMADKILNFIEKNYEKTFEKYFIKDREKVESYLNETDYYINERYFKEVSLKEKIPMGKLTSEYIERFKNISGLSSINLMIDRFDWTDGNSEISQTVLSEYFKLFDKSIITTDDEFIVSDETSRTALIQKGFEFIQTDYGKDIEIVKKIIALRINKYNSNLPEGCHEFPIELLSNQIMKTLLKKADGNISFILGSVNKIDSLWQWEYGSEDKTNLLLDAERCADRQIIEDKELKKMKRPIKLFLGDN
ncbi:MAG: hypothetical protein PHQ89_01730 [Bacilli bacterium]|nr:hypothetical protein [Bacilli bacterium]